MVLVIVLICIALLSVLILSFLIGARTEAASSKQYLTSSEVQNLASSALNFAMGQVALGAAATNNAISWASQPGMIRNYNNSGTSAIALYKLYSNSQMVITGAAAATFTPGTDVDPLWDTKPALYTDLNAPANYLANNGGTTTNTLLFPIVDPRAIAGANAVEGFSYTNMVSGGTMDGVTNAASATDPNARLPMPVQWLYVLQDGTFIAPDSSSSGTTATFNDSSTKPSSSNPIIGRIAFWTDDESSKVNINTASEGSYYDIPMATLTNEGPLAWNTPAAGEYQRYPGHPAQTSLSPIFPWLKGSTSGHTDDLFILMNPRTVTANIPPGCTGGSLEGTTEYTSMNALPVKTDRMYDSVDELTFDNNRGLLSTNSYFSSFVTTNGTGVTLAPTDLDNRRFFLTAHSRSPELTLFNTPRVAIWPLSSSTNGWAAAEQLIAKAATIGTTGNQYYFTRYLPLQATLTSGGNLDPASDFADQLTAPNPPPNRPTGRNAALLGYLQNMTSQSIPGYGTTSLASKWTNADRDQILVEIYDYIRSCLNLRASVLNGAVVPEGTPNAVSYTTTSADGSAAEVFPTVLTPQALSSLSVPVRGFGRFPTIKEVSIVFACSQNPCMYYASSGTSTNYIAPVTGPNNNLTNAPANSSTLATPSTAQPAIIWPAIVVEMFLPSQGFRQWTPNVKITASGLDSFSWTVTNPDGSPNTVKMFNTDPKIFNALGGVNGVGQEGNGYLGVQMLFCHGPTGGASPTDDPSGVYATNWAPQFRFNGGTVKLTVDLAAAANPNGYLAADTTGNPVLPANSPMQQQYSITFPAMTNDLPNPFMDPNTAGQIPLFNTMEGRMTDSSAGANTAGLVVDTWDGFTSPDIVKSMVVKHGDYRLVAAAPPGTTISGGSDPTANTFVPHDYYYTGLPAGSTASNYPNGYNIGNGGASYSADPNSYSAYNLHNGAVTPIQSLQTEAGYLGGIGTAGNVGQGIGQYVVSPALAYPYDRSTSPAWDGDPSISPGIMATNYLGRQGDWDNGLGSFPDGPFINKPDEGSNLTNNGSYSYFYTGGVGDAYADQQNFGPMRQITSPVMFGSLPTAIQRGRPWETLLFCPNPAASYSGSGSGGFTSSQHPGFASPPDYTLLDLFWMPVTEPYAISDSFSTAGKINLNYQILPFTYITRKTGMYAILANQEMAAFDETQGSIHPGSLGYKTTAYVNPSNINPAQSRYAIDPVATLSQFDTRFNSGDIFHSAADICSLFLVPQKPGTTPGDGNGYTADNMTDTSSSSFWGAHRLTGDNMRERPYNAIYPRVTTQSNVYTVYVKAQSLKQVPSTLSTAPTTFTIGKDVIQGEFQASYTFERYIDPNANLPTSTPDMTPLGGYYNLRVINQRTLSR